MAEALAQVFKFFGGKFKPWGKVKLGKFLGNAGKVLGPLAALGETYLNYREEVRKEEAERQLRAARADLRLQFDDAARQFDVALAEQEHTLIEKLYDEPLADANELVKNILSGARAGAQIAEALGALTRDIRSEIDRLQR